MFQTHKKPVNSVCSEKNTATLNTFSIFQPCPSIPWRTTPTSSAIFLRFSKICRQSQDQSLYTDSLWPKISGKCQHLTLLSFQSSHNCGKSSTTTPAKSKIAPSSSNALRMHLYHDERKYWSNNANDFDFVGLSANAKHESTAALSVDWNSVWWANPSKTPNHSLYSTKRCRVDALKHGQHRDRWLVVKECLSRIIWNIKHVNTVIIETYDLSSRFYIFSYVLSSVCTQSYALTSTGQGCQPMGTTDKSPVAKGENFFHKGQPFKHWTEKLPTLAIEIFLCEN